MKKNNISPCRNCTRVAYPERCENKCCSAWTEWFLQRWGLIHGYYKNCKKKEIKE